MAVAPRPIGKSDWESSYQSHSRNDWSVSLPTSPRLNTAFNGSSNQNSLQLVNTELKTPVMGKNHVKVEKQEETLVNRRIREHNGRSYYCRSRRAAFVVGLVLGLLSAGVILGVVLALKFSEKEKQNTNVTSTISPGTVSIVTPVKITVSTSATASVATVTSSTPTTKTTTTTTSSTLSTSTTSITTTPPVQICSDYVSSSSVLYFVQNSSAHVWTYPNYIHYSYNWTATSTSATLAFYFRHDPNGWMLDDITVYNGSSQLIVNGGFETGDLTAWNYSTSGSSCNYYTGVAYKDSTYAHGGSYYYYDRCKYSCDVIRQTFSTVPGGNYLISFYLTNYGCCSTTEIAAVTVT